MIVANFANVFLLGEKEYVSSRLVREHCMATDVQVSASMV